MFRRDYCLYAPSEQATGQTIRMVRDNLKHLEMTGEVTSQSTNRYRVITIVRYDEYQTSDKQNDKQMTNELTSKMTSKVTSKTATSKEYIEPIELQKDKKTPTVFSPPSVEEVEDYCRSRGNGIGGQEFVDFYESKGWMIGKNRMKDWKAAVRTWENERKKRGSSPSPAPAPANKPNAIDVHGYDQRSYKNAQQEAIARMMNDTWGDE